MTPITYCDDYTAFDDYAVMVYSFFDSETRFCAIHEGYGLRVVKIRQLLELRICELDNDHYVVSRQRYASLEDLLDREPVVQGPYDFYAEYTFRRDAEIAFIELLQKPIGNARALQLKEACALLGNRKD